MGKARLAVGQTIRLGPDRAERMLSAYRLNLGRGFTVVRNMIVEDIRRFSDLGAKGYVADLKEALLRFDEEPCAVFYPNAAYCCMEPEACKAGA